MFYLGVAYGITVAAILGYTLRLWLNERGCRRQMEALRESVTDR
jgi:sarcosine oxidase delta subunit